MSLHPSRIGAIPAETARVAHAAFTKGTVITRLRDEFAELYQNEDFRAFYPGRGQPGTAPWRLALVTVFQFLEHLSDRQAADAVRARIDWKYALGLELTDRGFHFSLLAEFRARLVAGGAEHLLLNTMLARFTARGLVKARGKQRTDSTHVLAAVDELHLLELVTETLRATLDDLAAVVPDWVRQIAPAAWFERYARLVEEYHLPKSQEKRHAFARQVGEDTASSYWMWMRSIARPHRPPGGRCRWSRRSAPCGGCSSPARTGARAGAPRPNSRRWASACSRRTTRRCTTASRGSSCGTATRCTSPRRATPTPPT